MLSEPTSSCRPLHDTIYYNTVYKQLLWLTRRPPPLICVSQGWYSTRSPNANEVYCNEGLMKEKAGNKQIKLAFKQYSIWANTFYYLYKKSRQKQCICFYIFLVNIVKKICFILKITSAQKQNTLRSIKINYFCRYMSIKLPYKVSDLYRSKGKRRLTKILKKNFVCTSQTCLFLFKSVHY